MAIEAQSDSAHKTQMRKTCLDLRSLRAGVDEPEERLIGLLLNHAYAYDRRILRGVIQYAVKYPHWSFVPIEPAIGRAARESLKSVDVAIVSITSRKWCDLVRRSGTPVVNVGCVIPDLPIARVGVDNALVGEMAAEHFLERGFRSFAFIGHKHFLFSIEREEGFRSALARSRHHVQVFHTQVNQDFDIQGSRHYLDRRVVRWLATLPRPTGLLAEGDKMGMEVIDWCRKAEVRVPSDIAVLGVNDDDFHCAITRPPMSSVVVPSEEIGMRAAALAEQLFDRRRRMTDDVLIAPPGITVRQSTDVLAIEDQDVAHAIRFVRENAHRPLQVADVLQQVNVSRRWLERRVSEVLGCTLGAEIRRSRLERAKRLLTETELSIARVAVLSGFRNFRHLADTFRTTLHQTPRQFRQTHDSNESGFASSD